MKKLIVLISCLIWISNALTANPDTLTLNRCLSLINSKSPVAGQKDISREILSNRLKNLNNNWFPSVSFNAQAIYNSETVEFSDLLNSMPGRIPSLPLDQYKVWAEINQQIYDGGMLKAMKEMEKSGYRSEIFQTEAELYSIKLQVSQVFFSLLLTQNNFEIIAASVDLLSARRNTVQAGVANGVILPENLLAIEAEKITLQQKLTELRLLKGQLISILNVLTDSTISENSIIVLPAVPESDQNGTRPELGLFEQQKLKLQQNEKLANRLIFRKFLRSLIWHGEGRDIT